MSCPSEFTWSVYVDGELSPGEIRRAEMHLVSCRDCRGQVVALRDEISALSSALEERVPAQPVARNAPVKELAWSLPAAVAAVTAVLAITGFLIEMRLPGALDLLNPRRLMGAYEMAFDAVFILRNRLPELFDAAASVGAMAAFSALGCAGLHALSRRLTKTSSLLLLLMLVSSTAEPAGALDLRKDQNTKIATGETVSETLICTGDVVIVDGTVDGDLVVAAERFTLRGTITGNLYAIGREVEIDGVVEGSIISVGERVRLGGRADGAVILVGQRVDVSDEARIARDLTLIGEGVQIAGKAARDVTFIGDWLEVRAEIGRNLHALSAERISLLDEARVGGGVRARLWGRYDELEQAPGASVMGEVLVSKDSIVREHYLSHYREPGLYIFVLVSAAAAFVFGLLVYLIDPRLFEADMPDARGFGRSLGIGFILILAGPVALFLIGLTVVGLPIAILGLFVLIASVYTSFVIVAGLVGHAVLKPSGPGLGAFAPSLLVGVLIVGVLAALPFVGPAIRILAVLFGLGCLFERVRGVHALSLRGVRG